MSLRAVIFVNGELKNEDAIRSFIKPDDLIICADRGAHHALALDLKPDLLIGDLDSLSSQDLKRVQQLDCVIERHPVDKDATDLELALCVAQQRNVNEVILIAAMGGRLDHALGNLLLMADSRFARLQIRLLDGAQTAWIIRDRITLSGKKGDIVSVLPLSPVVTGLTYHHGLRWSLQNFSLPFGSTRGMSNIMTENEAFISLESGILLVIHHQDNPEL